MNPYVKRYREHPKAVRTDLHREAMKLADIGDWLARAGHVADAMIAFSAALTLEGWLARTETKQPARAILHRSAAALAILAERTDTAIELTDAALSDQDVPGDIRAELEAVREQAHIHAKNTGREI